MQCTEPTAQCLERSPAPNRKALVRKSTQGKGDGREQWKRSRLLHQLKQRGPGNQSQRKLKPKASSLLTFLAYAFWIRSLPCVSSLC